MRLSIALFLAAATVFSASHATAFEVGARAAYWLPKLSGEFRLDGATKGDTITLTDDLGFDDEYFFMGDAWLWLGDSHITVSGTQIKYTGSKNLANIDFGEKTFAVDTDSKLEYTMLDLSYQYDLFDLENCLAGFSFGPAIHARYFDGEVSLSDNTQEETQSFQIVLPMVGVGAHVGVLADILEVRAKLSVLPVKKNYILDAQGEISFNPMPFINLSGGYRTFSINVEEDDLLLDYTQSGPYVGVSVVF